MSSVEPPLSLTDEFVATIDILIARERYPDAEGLAQQMVQLLPDSGMAWKTLGSCRLLGGDLAGALEPLRQASTRLPEDIELQRRYAAAVAWEASRVVDQDYRHTAAEAAARAWQGHGPAMRSARISSSPHAKPIRLVCGTRQSRESFSEQTALGRSLKRHSRRHAVQLLLFADNRQGLSTIYNLAIAHAEQDPATLVFVHDDVALSDFFWTERIEEALQAFDVVGMAGNRRRLPAQPAWCFTGAAPWQLDEPQHLSGAVGHGKDFSSSHLSVFGPAGQACKLLDGLLLAADSQRLHEAGLRFDEQFKFHFYDMDFCRQAELKGLRMGTWPLSVVHESQGNFGSPAWREAYEAYLRKYTE